MKPIAIFRHSEVEGPGYFATFLDAHSLPWKLIAIDQQQRVPHNAGDFAGICLMGGPMSVNDPLPWIGELCALIRDAVRRQVPVLGHCLGGQLISRALGGEITRNPVKEIGWGEVRAVDQPSTRHWLGDWLQDTGGVAEVFHWHGETFSIPPGAQRILGSACCANQAFTLGPHLALQCHIEMSAEMIVDWCAAWPAEVAEIAAGDRLPTSVQTPEQMQAQSAQRLPAMRRLADQLYSSWIAGVKSD